MALDLALSLLPLPDLTPWELASVTLGESLTLTPGLGFAQGVYL